ncbi:MAG: exodeoxyribonuclease VII small subunit [Gammaproteobacteria bacterium]|nr:exodeoxyribonuclease VII small subunit [Gammaproteobacteria bacterium]
MAKKPKTPDFESALHELENIVERMEKGELTLEESLQQFERGVLLTRTCQQSLQDAEQKVHILLKKDGTSAPVEFEATGDPSTDS